MSRNTAAQDALTQRIRELRRRHFGPRGAAEFARRLAVDPTAYARFERGALPSGEVLVRMCEICGEDLQWLLTGVASRGTVVISGARARHRDLLARIAESLDQRPALAAPLEDFLDLLLHGEQARASRPQLPTSQPATRIPIFEPDELPAELPGPGDGRFWLTPKDEPAAARVPAQLAAPAGAYTTADVSPVALVTFGAAADRPSRQYVEGPALDGLGGAAFGVRLSGEEMSPMFEAGDAALVTLNPELHVGRAVLCRFADEPRVTCRIWLGQDARRVLLGRVGDGGQEARPRTKLHWAREVVFRVARAA